MIEQRGHAGVDGRWRRAHDVLDDYDRGGALSEQLADELCNELVGLGPRAPQRRAPSRRPSAPRPGPQPSRPAPPPAGARPRLTLVRNT